MIPNAIQAATSVATAAHVVVCSLPLPSLRHPLPFFVFGTQRTVFTEKPLLTVRLAKPVGSLAPYFLSMQDHSLDSTEQHCILRMWSNAALPQVPCLHLCPSTSTHAICAWGPKFAHPLFSHQWLSYDPKSTPE